MGIIILYFYWLIIIKVFIILFFRNWWYRILWYFYIRFRSNISLIWIIFCGCLLTCCIIIIKSLGMHPIINILSFYFREKINLLVIIWINSNFRGILTSRNFRGVWISCNFSGYLISCNTRGIFISCFLRVLKITSLNIFGRLICLILIYFRFWFLFITRIPLMMDTLWNFIRRCTNMMNGWFIFIRANWILANL